MTAEVIYLHKYRAPTRIPPAVQQGYDDVRVAFARRVEQRLHEMDVGEALLEFGRAMAGNKPGDVE